MRMFALQYYAILTRPDPDIESHEVHMQGNLFDKLEEYVPSPKTKHRPAQRALPAEPEILPPERPARPATLDNPVAGLKDMPIFDDADVMQGVKIYDTTCGQSDQRAAVRAVMMWALRIAAVNLDVH